MAAFVAAYAFSSLFQPLFTSCFLGYVVRLVGECEDADGKARLVRTAFVMMQLSCAALVLVLVLVELRNGAAGVLPAITVASILFTPMTLFSAQLRADDRYVVVSGTSIAITIALTAVRIGLLSRSGDLNWAAATFVVGPILSGLRYLCLDVRYIVGRPWLSWPMAKTLARDAPTFMGGMLLGLLFWRSPILAAQWLLSPLAVVQIALCMQLVTGLMIIPSALTESLLGPLVLCIRDECRFREIVRIGSAVAWLCGIGAIGTVALLGSDVLRFAFGAKATGIAGYCIALSALCLGGGLERITTAVVTLKCRPLERVAVWIVVLLIQGTALAFLAVWPSLWTLAVMTPASLLIGYGLAPLLLPDLRRYAADVILGARDLFTTRSAWRRSVVLMFKG